jgi:hypothetical protein
MAGRYTIEMVRPPQGLRGVVPLCYRFTIMPKQFTARLSDKAREILEKEARAQSVSFRDVVELALRAYAVLRKGKRND